eukprot:scaffold5506_cov159-Amphora_coffeaeformis.AAC.13
MTTTPFRTPGPSKDKENNGGEPTPYTNLPSSLKLGTPFFRGTHRHRAVSTSTFVPLAVTTDLMGIDTPSQGSVESTLFPDELPLEMFRQQWSPRKSPTVKGSVEGSKEKTRDDATLTANQEDSKTTPLKATKESPSLNSDKRRQIRWTIPEEPQTVLEEGKLNAQLTSPLPASYGGPESKETTLDLSMEEDHAVQEPWENEHELTPCKLPRVELEEPDSPVEEIDDSMDAPSVNTTTPETRGDDFSAMIDALAADFREEIAAEHKKLENLSSGDSETDNNFGADADIPVGLERIKLLEKELQTERETREKLMQTYNEERNHLLEQMKEVQNNAELSIRLARQEANHRVNEERLLVLATREEMETAQDNAIVEATHQAAELLKESKKRQEELQVALEKLQSEHLVEMESALTKACEEAKQATAASLSIQRAATTQTLQREIFNIETELLETLDELETTKAERLQEQLEFEARISALKRELESERKDKQNTAESLEKEVEMFRVQLEEERRAAAEEEKRDMALKELAERTAFLEGSLQEANKTTESMKAERDIAISGLKSEVMRLTDLLKAIEERSNQESIARDKLKEEHDLLQVQIDEYSATIERLEVEKSQSSAEVEALRLQLMKLQEKSKAQSVPATENRKTETGDATITNAVNFLQRITQVPTDVAVPPSDCVVPKAITPSTQSLVTSPSISSNFEPIRVDGNGAF